MGKIGSEELFKRLEKAESPIAIMGHKGPDPDSIGSGNALKKILEEMGKESDIVAPGDIKMPENLALVDFLGLGEDIKLIDGNEELEDYNSFSFLDCRPDTLPDNYKEFFENNSNFEKIISIIDHHNLNNEEKLKERVESVENGIYMDVRSEMSATALMMAELIYEYDDMDFDEKIATSLYHGILTDTDNFIKPIKSEENKILAKFSDNIDREGIESIAKTEMSEEMYKKLSMVYGNTSKRGIYLFSNAGIVNNNNKGVIPISADGLMRYEGAGVIAVAGTNEEEGMIEISIRTRSKNADRIARDSFGQYGSAGGDDKRAGARINMGIYANNIGGPGFEEITRNTLEKTYWDTFGKLDEDE